MIKEIIGMQCAINSVEYNLFIVRAERNVLLEREKVLGLSIGFKRPGLQEKPRLAGSLKLGSIIASSTKQVMPNTNTVRLGPGYLRT